MLATFPEGQSWQDLQVGLIKAILLASKTIKLKQMTPFQKAGEGSVSLMESSFLWSIWQSEFAALSLVLL